MAVLEKASEWRQKGEPWMIELIKVSPMPSTVEACQRDPQWWRIFGFIAEQNYCSENVEFLDKVDEYSRAGNLGMAVEIYDRYVKDSAEKQVNLPSHVLRPLQEIFDEGQGVLADPQTFDDAYEEVRKLFERDTFATYSRLWDALRDEFLLADKPEAPKKISAPVKQEITRQQVDDAVVDNFNKTALKDLPLGASTSFYQVGDLVIIEAGMGEDQPFMKWIRAQPGVTQGAAISKTANSGAFSSGTYTVRGAGDKDLFKRAVAKVSKAKIVFE
jgi:hypothetical protein